MIIKYDTAKNDHNIRQRGLAFDRVAEFDFSGASIVEDTRHTYTERRFQALGLVAGRVHMLVFSPVPGGIRVISFRKANQREITRYEQATQP
ncbi:BrnT family toxin [Gilvimarinus polysaccharolyticus]|uniref:BrnT family toxin n=1 Tax=Gilvimarinus polysaccharolyticus TaxID=863921 RepID=UPI0006731B85|nr:BrnT family toxin [Gilvimarinus polysaccharolyticus]